MKRRRFLLFATLLLVVLAGYLVVPLGQPRISKENFEKIQYGWTEEEVKLLLGEPLIDMGENAVWSTSDSWDGVVDEGGILVIFSERQGVVQKFFRSPEISSYEQIRRRVVRRMRALWPWGVMDLRRERL